MAWIIHIGRAVIDKNDQTGEDQPSVVVGYFEQGALKHQYRVHEVRFFGGVRLRAWDGRFERPLSVRVWLEANPPFLMIRRTPTGEETAHVSANQKDEAVFQQRPHLAGGDGLPGPVAGRPGGGCGCRKDQG